MYRLSIFLFVFYCFLSDSVQAQLPYFLHYNTVQGLAGNQCYDLLQDSKGFVWVATASGVSKFDGSTFQNFTVENGLPDNEILKINEDSKGRIWFFALNGAVSYMYQNTIYTEKNAPFLAQFNSKSSVSSFFEDKEHRIWFGFTDDKVMVLNKNHVQVYHHKKINNSVFIQDSYGDVWAHTAQASFRFKNGKLIYFPHRINILNNKAIAATNPGYAFLNKVGSVYVIQHQRYKILTVIPDEFYDYNSKLFYTVSNQDIGVWVTKNQGVRYFTDRFFSPKYLADVKVNNVIKVKDGSYWFATNDGIFLLPNNEERYFIFNKKENDLFSDQVKSILVDNYNRTWIGYEEGVVDVLEQDFRIRRYSPQKSGESLAVKQFCLDSLTKTMFMITDFGIYFLENTPKLPSKFKELDISSIDKFAIKQMAISKHFMALATSSGVYVLNKNAIKKDKISIEDIEFVSSGRAFDVYFDKNETLWFSNIEGLFSYSNGKQSAHQHENVLLSKRIDDIHSLKDGTLVLATNGYGVLFYKQGKLIQQLTQINGLSSNICNKIFVQNDMVWIQTAKGCNYIIQKDGKFSIRNLNFIHPEISDNLTDLSIKAGLDLGYLASNKGLIMFVNKDKQYVSPSPKVYIRYLINNGNRINQLKNVVLNSLKTNLIVQFAAISYNNTSTGYRYQLNDEDWNETNTTKLEFASLLPGKYVLRISANRNNGEWSAPAVLNFEIKPPFWWKWWFVLLMFILVFAAIFYLVQSIIQRQRMKEKNELITQNKILALEQQALQAMMNPHFVFNIMNAIQHFINTKDNAGANRMLTGFARLIRKNLDICTKSKISIQEEVNYLELYLKLEKMRFGDKLHYHIEIDKDIDIEEVQIPSMLLQPFVENSLWHGIMPKEEGGYIEIKIQKMDSEERIINISIIDDGIGITHSQKNKKSSHVSKGMMITKERIALITQIEKKNIDLQIYQTGDSGTCVLLAFSY